jgi:hypothetical protein
MNAAERTAMLADQKRATGRTHRVWARDEWRDFEVWEVPVDVLLLNVDNRRFAAERKLMEEKLGRSLDVETRPDDERSIISILLDVQRDVVSDQVVGKPSKDAQSLHDDWLKRKQESPFWIRPDGTVRNGNRRLAMVKRLREEVGDDASQYVDALILDLADISESDLFEMEQREQLTDNQKMLYTDINRLLTIREAAMSRGIDWGDPESVTAVAGQIQHLTRGNKSDAAVQLRAIRYMDAFLADSESVGQYEKAFGSVENFRDIGRNMAMLDGELIEYADDMLRVCFASMRANRPFQSIRGLRRLFRSNREAFNQLVARIDQEEDTWRAAGGGSLGEPDISGYGEAAGDEEEEVEESGEETGQPSPVVPNYPTAPVRSLIDNALDAMDSRRLDVQDAVQQALSRLDGVVPTADVLGIALAGTASEDIRAAVLGIIAWAEQARTIIEG